MRFGRSLFDDEENELIEADDYVPGSSLLTPERKTELQASARETMKTIITLRVRNSDLAKLEQKAAEEGMPYQTLINSISHKVVS